MGLQPPFQDAEPERILAAGAQGTGKTSAWLSIARWSQKTGSDAKFWAMDTDRTVKRMLQTPPEDKGFNDLRNVEYRLCRTWEDLGKATDAFYADGRPQDWIVLDSVSPVYDRCQESFTQSIFGESKADYFMQARAAMAKIPEGQKGNKKGAGVDAFESWKDWQVIRGNYFDWLDKLFLQWDGHVFATAEIDKLAEKGETRENMTVYGPFGVKPRGEKSTGHRFHTNLWFSSPLVQEIFVTTLKDRGRKYMESEKVADFAMAYLLGRANWRLA